VDVQGSQQEADERSASVNAEFQMPNAEHRKQASFGSAFSIQHWALGIEH
jgi:hypothetical protein